MPAYETTFAESQPEPVAVQPRDAEPAAEPPLEPVEQLVEADLLIEDVSIDGMCGVY